MSRGGRGLAALANLALAVVAVGAALGAAELFARWRFDPPRTHDAPLELAATLGFRGVPHYHERGRDEQGEFDFALDADGWREAPPPAPGAEALPRIAFFGDSFLVGRALRREALLPSRVAQALAALGTPVTTLDFSVIDYGTAQQLLVLREQLGRLAPDAVVLAFYTGNDLVNNEPALAGATDVSPGDYVRPYLEGPDFSEIRFLHPARARLRSVSRLYATLEMRALALALRPGFAWLRPFPPTPGQSERQRARRAPTEALEVLRPHEPGSVWEQAWQRSFGLVRQFRREVEASGARFLVLLIPLEEQVLRGAKLVAFDWASRSMAGTRLDDVLDWNLPERRFAGFFAAEGIDAVLLRDPLRALAAQGENPYGRDRHLSAAGHARAAQAVVDWWLGAGAAPAAGDGEPVAWVPPAAEAPSALDFRRQDQARYLGDGWLDWRAESDAASGGWRIGPRSMAVLPDPGGDVVLRGHAGGDVDFPVAVTLELAGFGQRARVVAEPGAFELRVSRPRGQGRAALDYSVVLAGQRGRLDADLRIQELAIEPR